MQIPFPAPELIQMIYTHSQFTSVVLNPCTPSSGNSLSDGKSIDQFKPSNVHPAKTFILRLIRTIMSFSPTECCISSYLPILASAYFGTVASSDKEILHIWYLYESGLGISVAASAASWEYKDSTNENTNNHGGATGGLGPMAAAESIMHINSHWMGNTINWMSFDSEFSSDVGHDSVASGVFSGKLNFLYDPFFFLPLIATSICSAGDRLDLKRLVDNNCVGLAVAALSSENITIRKVAYFIMSKINDMYQVCDELI